MPKRIIPTSTPGGNAPVILPRVAFSIPEAASATSLSASTLYDLMAQGELPYVKVRTRRLITAQALADFMTRNAQGPRVA